MYVCWQKYCLKIVKKCFLIGVETTLERRDLGVTGSGKS